MDTLRIRQGSVEEPAVRTVIETHFAQMRAQSPEESCHVLPPDAFDGQTLLVAENNGEVLGVGALMQIAPGHGEIKSMHTLAKVRGKGVARAILRGLRRDALAQGLTRLSLETGSDVSFAPARALYTSEGFTTCPPFGTYKEDPLSTFMTSPI